MARNLSMNDYFTAVAADHAPAHHFAGSTQDDWRQWREALRPKVIASLGKFPEKVPLNAEVQGEWTDGGLIKQRVIFDVEKHLSAVALVFRPAKAEGRLPVILACHGHGPFGKDAIMGSRATPQLAQNIDAHNYDYGLRMAQAGYVVIAIDWRGFGERDDQRKPNWRNNYGEYDACSANLIRSMVLGMSVLSMNVHDGMAALDYVTQQDFADPERIGVMGLSYGGTMTLWMALCDERIRAADIMGYSDVFADFCMRDNNACGSQVTQGLYELCDVPDLQGLLAPRPLLVEIGAYDDCFMLDSAMKCFRQTEKIYAAAGVRDRLELDLFEGGHRWGGNKSKAFFDKHLK